MRAPLYQQFVKQRYMLNKEQIDALPDEQKRQVLQQMIDKSKSIFKEGKVSEGTNRKLVAAAAKNRRMGEQVRNMEHQGQPFDREAMRQKQTANLEPLIQQAELESSGVVMDRDLPDSWELGFGADIVADTKAILDNHYDSDVNVIHHGQHLIYIDPKTKEPVKVNYGAKAKLGYGIPMATDVAGTIAGGGMSKQVIKQVAGETAGSFLGSGLGEYIRLGVGSVMGVHDLTAGEMFSKAAAHGGEAALWTGGIGGAIAGLKGVKNFLSGGIFTLDEAAKYGLSAEDAQLAIDEYNQIAKRTKGKEFKGTAYQKTGDVDVGHQEAIVRDSSEHSKAYAERLVADQESLAGTTKDVLSPQLAPYSGVDEVGMVARGQDRAITGAKEAEVSGMEKTLQRQIEEPSSISHFSVGKHSDEYLSEQATKAKDNYELAYDEARQAGGFDDLTQTYGIDVPMGENVTRYQKILKAKKEASFTNVGSETSSIFKPKTPDAAPDLNFYNDEIGKLKNKLRNIATGVDKSGTSKKELGDIIGAYQEDRAIALLRAGKDDLLLKIEAAEQAASDFHTKWRKGYVGKLLEVKDGVRSISRPAWVEKTLAKGREATEELKSAISDDPTLTLMWKEGIADMYTRKAYKGQKFNRQASDDFLEKYGESLDLFFSKKEIDKFRATGDFAETVAKERAEQELFKKNAKTQGLGILSNVSPEGMWKFMKGGSGWQDASAGYAVKDTLSKIKFVKNMTKKSPAAFQRLQNDYREDLVKRIYNPESGYIDHKKFAAIIENEREVVIEMLGKRTYKDLTTINKVVRMASKRPAQSKQDLNELALWQTIRIYAAPLSPRGRAFSAGLLFKKKTAQTAMAKAILDERTIREVAKLAEHSKPTRQFFEKAYSLGLFREDEE